MASYIIEKTLAEISRTNGTVKKLTLTGWSNNPAKLDLRTWLIVADGDAAQPGRGVTLTDEEARTLADALNAYLSGK